MGAALLIARSRLRRNTTATVLLVLLAGLGGGIVMASVAGIRRADESWQRFQIDNPVGDAGVVFFGPEGPEGAQPSPIEDDFAESFHVLAAMDEVEVATRATAAVGMLVAEDGTRFPVAANLYLDVIARSLVGDPVIVDGALPDAAAEDDVAINELLAERLDVRVGDRVPLTPFRYDEIEAASDGRDDDPGGRTSDLRVTGIVRHANDLLPPRTDQFALYSDAPYMMLTPAWWRSNGPDVGIYGVFVFVDLRDGVDFAAFQKALAARFGEMAFALPDLEEVGVPTEVQRSVDRQIDAEGRAVTAFALAVALVAVSLLVLALGRQLAAESADRDDLLALGVTTRSLLQVGLLRSAVIAAGASIASFAVALGLSAWLPVGVGRRTLRTHGIHVDAVVLGVGPLVVGLTVVLLVVLVGWRVSRRSPLRSPRPSFATRLASAGAPPVVTVGVHLATERSVGGRAARSAMVVAGVAVAVLVAALGLISSLHDLRTHPERLGQVWDASAGNFASPVGLANGLEVMSSVPGIDAVAGELEATAEIRGRSVSGVAYEPFEGEIVPELEAGRSIEQPDEMVMGESLARSLDVAVGDRLAVQFQFAEAPTELRVVGIGPVASMGFDTDPGRSILIHPDVAHGDPDVNASVLLVRFAHDADHDATLAELRRKFPVTVLEAPVPSRSVQTLSGLTVLPVALAAIVTALALAAAANGALAAVRRRRRDLAILKVLGMRSTQLRQVVQVQSLTWAVVALLVGLPAGVALASLGWRQVARSLGLHSPLSMPSAPLALVLVATPAILLALTWWPARRAAATRPAVTLRSE
jgi:ABC-type lipoprotein release transport system permease subunit